MKQPKITIGITSFNAAETIATAIESALAQDWDNFEIIVVDDASGDDSVAVIKKTIAGHDNARLIIHPQNKGFAGTLNTIISEAKGDLLAIFDDDDVSRPDRVRRQFERITKYESLYKTPLVICHVARMQKYPDGHEHYEPTMGTQEGLAPHGEAVVDRILTGRLSPGVIGSCANCSRMAHIEVFRKMNGYDFTIRRAEDTDFNIRFGLAGGHFVGISDPLVIQTMTMGHEKTLEAEKQVEAVLLEKYSAYLQRKGWYDFCLNWLDLRYFYLNNQHNAFFKGLLGLTLKHPIKVLMKLAWAIPAHATRSHFKTWHLAEEPVMKSSPAVIPNPAPLITIGMTCYNAEDTILRALNGALAQDWPNVEIVIVDDGSVDQSVAILQKTIQNNENIKLVVHENNKGFPAALNTLIAHAKGEVIAIFDDDDQSRGDRISCQYRTIVDYERKTGASLVACYASGIRFYPNGYQVHFQAIGSRPKIPVGLVVADHLLFFQHAPGVFFGGGTPSCSLMTRKTTYAAVGPYDETLRRSEDTDFSVRLARQGGHFIGCAEELIYQYSTGGEDKKPLITYQGYCALIEKHRDYLVSRKRYGYALAWQKFKYHHFAHQPLHALGTLALLAARHPMWTLSQFGRSAPKRLIHEWKMRRQSPELRGRKGNIMSAPNEKCSRGIKTAP